MKFQGPSVFGIAAMLLTAMMMISCENQEVEVPPHLMPEDEFVEAYADVQLLEATIKQKLLRGRDSEEEIEGYYQEIFEDKGRSRDLFEETKTWYAQHPELLQSMVEKAMEVISRKQAGLEESDAHP